MTERMLIRWQQHAPGWRPVVVELAFWARQRVSLSATQDLRKVNQEQARSCRHPERAEPADPAAQPWQQIAKAASSCLPDHIEACRDKDKRSEIGRTQGDQEIECQSNQQPPHARPLQP